MARSILSLFSSSINVSLPLLGEMVLKGTAMLILVFVVAAAMRRASAGTRHVVWNTGLAAILALPLIAMAVPWRLEVLPPMATVLRADAAFSAQVEPPVIEATRTTRVTAYRVEADGLVSRTNGGHVSELAGGASETGRAATQGERTSAGAEWSPAPAEVAEGEQDRAGPNVTGDGGWLEADVVLSWLLAAWAIGALVLVARVGGGALTVGRITRRARPLDSKDWTTPLWEAADRLDLPRVPRLFMSDRVRLPFTCGLFRPAIVLPASAAEWTDERRRAVLFHELGHVRRFDLLSHLVGRIACALYWFHPMVWLAARRARAESERACDDLVLSTGTRPSAYADHLLQLVAGAAQSSAPVVAIPMAQRKEFEGRMLAILEPGVARGGPNRAQSATLVVSIAVLALSVAAMAPISEDALPNASDGGVATVGARADDEMLRVMEEVVDPTVDAVVGASANAAASAVARASSAGETEASAVASVLAHSLSSTTMPISKPTPKPVPAPTPRASGWRADLEQPAAALRRFVQQRDGQDTRAVAALTAALRDPIVKVRSMAAHTLGEIGDSAAVAALSEALRTDEIAEVRRMAAWALGEIGEPTAVPALSAAVREDEDAEVRRMAAWALGEIEDERAIEALGAATTDADPSVVKMAVWALGEIDSPNAAPYLVPALQSPDAEVRRDAVSALAETETAEAVEPLIVALRDEDGEVRSRAAAGLAELEDPRAVPALAAALDDASPEVRRRAAWAIGELEPASAPDALSAALRDADEEVRGEAARALGEIADAASAEALTAALGDSSANVRRTALRALGEIGGPIAQEALLEAIRSEDPEIRKMAAQALARTY